MSEKCVKYGVKNQKNVLSYNYSDEISTGIDIILFKDL
jgi:hypothetical protein